MQKITTMPMTYPSAGELNNRLSAWHGTSRQGRTQPAIAYVTAQFGNKITLEHVARLCSLSTSQFCRVFKHEQGISFGQYLLHYRLERACERLGSADVLAKEVAYSVGFNDLSYFTWAFKRQVGVCPSHYIESRPTHNRPNT